MTQLSTKLIKSIFGNVKNGKDFLLLFPENKWISIKTIKTGKNKGKRKLDIKNSDVFGLIAKLWNYNSQKEYLRKVFRTTEKYVNGKNAESNLETQNKDWESLKLGPIKWPFSQGRFDDFVQGLNASNKCDKKKDKDVSLAAIRFRRIKAINTHRNDFIEYLLFEEKDFIIPTFRHKKGIDFLIHGIPYDQKVSCGPTAKFKKDFGDNWRDKAIERPQLVAKYLYSGQDEGRFGHNNRVLVVYLDDNISASRIKEIIKNTDLVKPKIIKFSYKHSDGTTKNYKAKCFIILLYN